MTNKEIVAILEEIALLLELSGESPFKSRAYTSVARRIEQSEEDVSALATEGRLREIEGVGDALEQKITELVTTGKLEYHEKLRKIFPESLFELFGIPGLGAKRIKMVYDELGIASRADLKEACETGKLEKLKGFGQKMEKKILEGIAFAEEQQGLNLYDKAYRESERLLAVLREEPSIVRMEVAGSLRRCKEIVKDIDIIVSSDSAAAVMDRFVGYEGVARVTNYGETKSSVVLTSGIAADLRVVSDGEYPYALMYFTGSKEHNVVLRQRAKERGMKLNEYGLYEGETLVKCKDEGAIYKALELPYIQPELREDHGEFDLTKTPELVEREDLVGLIHCHTTYSDGQDTITAMATAAKEAGFKYITITDHSQTAAYAGGLTPKRIASQHKEIDKVNQELKGITILKGIESDILGNGDLDYKDEVLETFDLVIASVHSKLEMSEKEATERVIKAIENPYTTILGHPTGRLLLQRQGFPLTYSKVFDACAANNVAIEINANAHRLDLDWRVIHQAKERGCRFSIGPDAHSVKGIDDVRYGVGIARKGGLEPGDLVNTLSAKEFMAWRKKG